MSNYELIECSVRWVSLDMTMAHSVFITPAWKLVESG